jgi:RNA polymerase sigma-70 factor (ECF subfamily)
VEPLVDRGRPVTGVEAADARRIEAYLRGESAACAEIESWIRGEIRSRYRMLHQELDDLCQVVHGKLLVKLRAAEFRHESSLRTYVSRILHHSCIDRLRRRYRESALMAPDGPEPLSSAPDPYEVLTGAEDWQLLHQAVLLAPEGCRELWRLAFVERLPYEEIAERLSIPPGTVKSRMWSCRKRAAETLERLRARHGSRLDEPR